MVHDGLSEPLCLACFASSLFLIVPPPPTSSPLSLHDALPIFHRSPPPLHPARATSPTRWYHRGTSADGRSEEHTSESSHLGISYAVFCLKKKNAPHPPHPLARPHGRPRAAKAAAARPAPPRRD